MGRHRHPALINTRVERLEPDERFVMHRVATWVRRILSRYPDLDSETLEMLTWVLGSDVHLVGDAVLQCRAGLDCPGLSEDLAECRADPSDYPRTILKAVSRVPALGVELDRVLQRQLDSRLNELRPRGTPPMARAVTKMQKAFGLTDIERELFLHLFVIQGWDEAERYFENHLGATRLAGRKYLGVLLDATAREVAAASRGTLVRAGIVEDRYGGIGISSDYTSALRDPLREMMPQGLYRSIPAEALPLERHAVDAETTSHLLGLLRSPAKSPVHILLYGPPGVGKTTYGRRLAGQVDIPALEVPPNEGDKTSLRRTGLVACMHLDNQGKGVILLVDEADSLLGTAHSWLTMGNRQDKGWLNELLDRPGARVIWIVNETSGIDGSVLRRFAFSVHFEPLTRVQRVELWDRILRRRKLKRFFSRVEIDILVRKYDVSAGIVDLAVLKASECGRKRKDEVHRAVTMALKAHQTLQYGGRLPPAGKEEVDKDYSLEGLNIAGDVHALLRRLEACDRCLRQRDLKSRRGMNVLCYGPPGTGKSELARYIAKHLDRQLIVKRTSDIMSCWVGSTEQAIAEAFSEAEREDAVLVLDEIDTLLHSRGAATKSWEVSFTNEMLTQMERFEGILICTTNRLTALDQASIRRFSEKIEFDFLTQKGNAVFYRKMLEPIALGPLDDDSRRRLMALKHLSPGDFRIARDRWAWDDNKPSHAELISGLEAEARIKEVHHGGRGIGF